MTRARLVGLLEQRHSLAVESAVVVVLYALYETTRGLVVADPTAAVRHARSIVSLERTLHVFVEPNVQSAARALPGLLGTLGVLYLCLHLAGTGAYLLWLHQRRPAVFATVRTALLLASGIALIGYLVFPAAPPRLAGVGVADTIARDGFDLNHGLVSSLYNPFAAVPSIHICYALIVGTSLVRHGGRRSLRVLGVVYPLLVLLVIIATGNHFLFDAITGAAVAVCAMGFVGRTRASARVRSAVPVEA